MSSHRNYQQVSGYRNYLTSLQFLQRATTIHGDKFYFPLLKWDEALSSKSRVSVVCRKCESDSYPRLDYFWRIRGCHICSSAPKTRWTAARFLDQARLLYGDSYSYPRLRETDHIGSESRIMVVCNKCNRRSMQKLTLFLSQVVTCAQCARNDKTLSKFWQKVQTVHCDRILSNLIQPNDLKDGDSSVNFFCADALCTHHNTPWTMTVDAYLRARGYPCPECKRGSYSSQRFIALAKALHGDSIDYSLIPTNVTLPVRDNVPLLCTLPGCKYATTPWMTGVGKHIGEGNGCPSCARRTWTKESFIARSQEIHGFTLNYELVTNANVRTGLSCVPLKCLSPTCRYFHVPFITPVRDHFRHEGCPSCAKDILRVREYWSLESFIAKSKEIHGPETFNYNELSANGLQGYHSPIILRCVKAGHVWHTQAGYHLHKIPGCPDCANCSYGESICQSIFQELNITYQCEVRFANLNRRFAFDFVFEYDGKACILEYDGGHHFIETTLPCGSGLTAYQERDRKKSLFALEKKYFLIRIDHTCVHHIRQHIENALKMVHTHKFYLSTPHMYAYMSDFLNPHESTVV